ncbi:hybrid sensor histidine kinase/response regulator [Noviherbaspirillum aridicola]|uniref:histidine kinase n=1 Tax=Noviherbaspirillum aridicola TaxID=2849687 RepID=A0ABQ4Q026_9BURK|nr:HAMP domain-containing sensor histidine kinase [Noviherbaspirillum aridicola]GIZ50110.1 hybrid sensor histidine kinase/response regulator [Noviherbaspirillum aridicola]
MSSINVLVVDDFPQNLVAAEAMLARPGLTVLKAASGVEALELLLTHEVALALIDVQMPEMDGFALAELIRGNKRTAGIPLIFMTAAAAEGARTFRGYQAGAVDFLNKPVDPEVLRGKVEVFVQLQAQKEQIRLQVEELRHALKMNEMFIAVLGHDLRTPLSAVLHGAELLMHTAPDERAAITARRIRDSGERMEKMVRQLLDVAQLRAGTLLLNPGRASYRNVCDRIVQEIEHVASASRVKVTCRGELEGEFDVDRMSQVISNLIANALQHGEGDSPITVDLDGSEDDRIRIRVHNQGRIPEALLPNLFRPFHADGKSRTAGAGLGLGLYIVKRFVEAHRGHVDVTSDEREGTRFDIELPRRVPRESLGDLD